MKIHFYKYQGTGNDFIMIDNRDGHFPHDQKLVAHLCKQKMGIGADGLILIQEFDGLDFEMVYFNSDGSQSLCGNGARCAVKFAHQLEIIESQTRFQTIDGAYEAIIDDEIVHVHMKDQDAPEKHEDHYFLNNGSPHHILFVDNAESAPVFKQGKTIRNTEQYSPNGTNVNFVEITNQHSVFVRTYERGVEEETLSCGTGITASCLAAADKGLMSPIKVKSLGGDLEVRFEKKKNGRFEDIWLIGPAKLVFEGNVEV